MNAFKTDPGRAAGHPAPQLRNRPGDGLAALSPAYFGLVMATGIVSLAAYLLAVPGVANTLFMINVGAYVVLWLLTLLRLVRYPQRVFEDLIDHVRGPGFFTVVAGTCVLGSQFLVLADAPRIALALWVAAVVLWVGLNYAIFLGLTVKRHKPSLQAGINGAWLLAVVATQAIAALGTLLAATVALPYQQETHFLAVALWLWGGMLYIWMMSLIFYRYTFCAISPSELTPPYWINMGAMAISTLTGSLLLLNTGESALLLALQPFIKGMVIFYWATGTWWIPMLLLLGVWRYGHQRFPLRYDPLYWGAVFPLGMYTVGTHQMIEAMGLEFLRILPQTFVYVAVAAWMLTFAGLVHSLWRQLMKWRG